MKLETLTNEELKNINGGDGVRYSESFSLGEKVGDYVAGLINGYLTVRGLKKSPK
mgnify:FL=1